MRRAVLQRVLQPNYSGPLISGELAQAEAAYNANLGLIGTGLTILPNGTIQQWVPGRRDLTGEPTPGHWENVGQLSLSGPSSSGAANNFSWWGTFARSFFGGFSLKSARSQGESFGECVSRVRAAGGSATAAVDAVSGVGVATSLASYPSLINTTFPLSPDLFASSGSFGRAVVSNSFIEQAAMESSIVYGSLPASSVAVAQKASSALWSGGGLVTAAALGLEGGVLGACR
jgi:hypothetical protein